MNGTPKQITVSLALSKRFSVEDMDEFYSGLRLACQQYKVDIVGGDTTSSLTGFAISITCIGEADKDKVVYRNGAKDTDLICVSGDLGAAYMGLQLLEREKAVFKGEQDAQPDFSGKEYLLELSLIHILHGNTLYQYHRTQNRLFSILPVIPLHYHAQEIAHISMIHRTQENQALLIYRSCLL